MSGASMSKYEIIKIAGEAGAKAALNAVEKERKKDRKSRYDRRLRNTKILLKNYRSLKAHAESAVFDAKKVTEENAIDILDLMWENGNDIKIESIKNSVARTVIIIQHIDDMLDIYETICYKTKKEEEHRRCRIIFSMYIRDELSIEEIAENEHIDKRTVYRDIDAAIEKLSALIFGIDGLEKT